MIRVSVVDDHHAVRLGLHTAIRSEPGLVLVGAVPDGSGVPEMLRHARPDVLLLDYHLPDVDGLTLCRRIKSTYSAPAVIVYSAFADPAMTVPAIVAGADGIVHKGTATLELFDAIRRVARGRRALPPILPELLETAGSAVDESDLPILAMLIDATQPDDIAETLRENRRHVDARIDVILRRLRVPVGIGGF